MEKLIYNPTELCFNSAHPSKSLGMGRKDGCPIISLLYWFLQFNLGVSLQFGFGLDLLGQTINVK